MGDDGVRWVRRQRDVAGLVAAAVVVGAGSWVVRRGSVPSWERALFGVLNGAPEWLYVPLGPFQQLGMLLVGPAAALGALLAKRRRLALGALLATLAKLGLERVVKAMVDRQRPATSIGRDAVIRGDVNLSGGSYVSGHAVLAAALATIAAPYLPARWRPLPGVAVGLVMVARVYVGAHNPLDVVGGAALGVLIGCTINLLLGVPRSERVPRSRISPGTDAAGHP